MVHKHVEEHASFQENVEGVGSGLGTVFGVVVLTLLAILFLVYDIPVLRSGERQTSVNIPEKINVSVR